MLKHKLQFKQRKKWKKNCCTIYKAKWQSNTG